MLWESLPDKNFISTWNNLPRHRVFADSLLIASYVQGALRKELLMAPFIKRFKTVTLRKSYWWILPVLGTIYFRQNGKPHKDPKSLLLFSLELSDALILANNVNPSSSRGKHPKRRSLEGATTGKKPTQPLLVTDVRFDQVAHWPSPTTNKNRCRLCSMTCRMQCSTFKIFLCLQADRNCSVDFHTKP